MWLKRAVNLHRIDSICLEIDCARYGNGKHEVILILWYKSPYGLYFTNSFLINDNTLTCSHRWVYFNLCTTDLNDSKRWNVFIYALLFTINWGNFGPNISASCHVQHSHSLILFFKKISGSFFVCSEHMEPHHYHKFTDIDFF